MEQYFNWRNRLFMIDSKGERVDLYKYGNRLVSRDKRELVLSQGLVRNKRGQALGYPVFRLRPEQQGLLRRIAEAKTLTVDKMDKNDRIRLKALTEKGLVAETSIGVYAVTSTGTVNLDFGDVRAPN